MKDLCDMTRAEIEDLARNSTGLPVPPNGTPKQELHEWFVAGTLVIGSRLGGRDAAIQFARERFDEDPDGAPFHAILDRVLNGEMDSLAADALAKAPDAPAAAPAPVKPKRRRARHRPAAGLSAR